MNRWSFFVFLLIFIVQITIAIPTILYGPELQVETDSSEIALERPDEAVIPSIPIDSLESYEISVSIRLINGPKRAFILLCDGQIVEIHANSLIEIDPEARYLNIIRGGVFVHIEDPPAGFCYDVTADSAELRYFGRDSLYIETKDTSAWLPPAGKLRNGEFKETEDSWAMTQSKDARYLFRQYDNGDIPAPDFKFKFPSIDGPIFHHTSRGKGGIATYKDETYYYAGAIYRANLWELEFAYDFWFAFSEKGKFYSEAWDEWSDLVDHIHHIILFRRGDPFFLRAGLIENISYGKGLLVANYDNSVLLPFEKKNGLQMEVKLKNFHANAFINDIGYPRIAGFHTRFINRERKMNITATLVADFDMYSSIKDRDGDSYPDVADPEPEIYNLPSDSVISFANPPSLRDVGTSFLIGAAGGASGRILTIGDFRAVLSGEAAMLSNLGTGISAPDLTLRYGGVSIVAGMDFQTPGFFDGIIDGNYEHDRGYVLEQEDGSYAITGRTEQLAETEGWLYGWNNSFSVKYPKYVIFSMKFRDLYREDSRDKRLGIYLENRYPWTPYIHDTKFFIEQKNVTHLFQRKTDGEQWGFSVSIWPHNTIRINLRYRETYDDANLNGEIGSGEIDRNFDGNVVIHGEYWLKKFIEWRRKKALE